MLCINCHGAFLLHCPIFVLSRIEDIQLFKFNFHIMSSTSSSGNCTAIDARITSHRHISLSSGNCTVFDARITSHRHISLYPCRIEDVEFFKANVKITCSKTSVSSVEVATGFQNVYTSLQSQLCVALPQLPTYFAFAYIFAHDRSKRCDKQRYAKPCAHRGAA